MRMENWIQIEDFPNYEVSDHGNVRNAATGRILKPQDNGRGILQVFLHYEKKVYPRTVRRLVAHHHLHPGPESAVPVHLDGDPYNNHVDNLEWKPLWFATKLTRQNNRKEPRDHRPIRMVSTGEIYDNALHCAREIGGLEELVLITARNPNSRYKGSQFEFVRF